MTNRKLIDSLIFWIAWLGASAILLVFAIGGSAQTFTEVKKARITGGQAIDRAADAWKKIYDYQTILHQIERNPNGELKEFWARASMVRPTEEKKDLIPAFLLQMYDQPVALAKIPHAVTDTQPIKVYFADASDKFYTYNPSANTLRIEHLDENSSPMPEEFMYLAGFLDFDIETFKQKAYIDSDVYQETVDGVACYRIRIQPRKKLRDVEPPRDLWIDRETNLPRKFSVQENGTVEVYFLQCSINQGLKSEDLVPNVREDTVIDDQTL